MAPGDHDIHGSNRAHGGMACNEATNHTGLGLVGEHFAAARLEAQPAALQSLQGSSRSGTLVGVIVQALMDQVHNWRWRLARPAQAHEHPLV